jgi:PAS domain S-box-containing protein
MPQTKGNILVVDDTPANLQLLIKLLAEHGFLVRPAPTGAIALRAAFSMQPDLIMLDIKMPEMDGYQVCQALKADERTKNIPIIFLSALDGTFDKVKAFAVGGIDYVTKPFQGEEVVARVKTHLALRDTERKLQQEVAERRQAEAKLQALFAAMTDVVLVLDRQGHYVDIAPTSPQLLYRPASELLGKTLHEVFPHEQADFFLSNIHTSLDTHKTVTFEYTLMVQERDVWFEARVSPMSQDAVIFIGHDITERKRTEQIIQQSYQQMQDDLFLAGVIQQSLLPHPHPDWFDLEVLCYNRPVQEVGGDFYCYQTLQPLSVNGSMQRRHVVAVGDVSGKGVSAALLMAVSLSQFNTSMDHSLSPKERITYLDTILEPYMQPRHQNCALCYVEFDLTEAASPIIHIVNAGCIPPYIKRLDGTVDSPEVSGFPLGHGLWAKSKHQGFSLELAKGDMVVLTSDGVVEAINEKREILGFERLLHIFRHAPTNNANAMLEHLKEQMLAFTGNAKQHDDMTIVVVRV